MQITTHQLTNPVEGQPSACVCGWFTDSVSVDQWMQHITASGGEVHIVVPGTTAKAKS